MKLFGSHGYGAVNDKKLTRFIVNWSGHTLLLGYLNVRYYDLYIGGYPADEIESLTKHKYDEGFFGAKYKWSPFIGCITTLGRVVKI